jgi:hypothetical protein
MQVSFVILLFGLLSSCSDGTNVSGAKRKGPDQPVSKVEVQNSDLDSSNPTYPVVMLDAKDVCQGITYYDKEGQINHGLRVCESAEASPNLIPENIKQGVTIGGITGTMVPSRPECSADGELSCTTNPQFLAARVSGLEKQVLAGATVAGVAGTVVLPGASQVLAGVKFGANGAAYSGSLTLPLAKDVRLSSGPFGVGGTGTLPTLADCSSDGAVGCVVAGPGFAVTTTVGLAAKVITGQTVAGIAGTAATESHANCTADGGLNCVSNSSYRAAATSGLAAKIVSGQTVAGIAGTTAAESHSNCSADGATGCVATSSYRAASTTGLAAKIVSGNTVAGIIGTASAESHSNCSADGATGCVATASYTAAATASLATKILSGQTVAGIAGNVTLPAVGHVLSGINFGINGTSSSGTLTLPAAANVRTSNGSYGASGTGTTPTLANCSTDGGVGCVTVGPLYAAAATTGLSTKVVSGQTVAGISGTAIAESHSNCATAGAVGCVTTALYKPMELSAAGSNSSSGLTSSNFNSSLATSANFEFWDASGLRHQITGNSALNAGNIKSGVSVFGLTGGYPSATYPLANNTATTDLTTFITQLTTDGTFEFFDSQGTRYTGSGDSDLVAGNIANGIVLGNFGITGTATGAAPNEWDIRRGTVVNGVTGKLVLNCRNSANSLIYNSNTSLPGENGRLDEDDIDWWDTIDNYNNNSQALPTQIPTGTVGRASWYGTTCSGAAGIWGDETPDGACNTGADDCVMRDKITNLLWSESHPVPGVAASNPNITWSDAVNFCYNLNFAGMNLWRVPTQFELAEAIIHGIRDIGYNGLGLKRVPYTTENNDFFIKDVDWPFWTATTLSTDTTKAWNYTLDGLDSLYTGPKSGSVASVICVR